MKILLSDYLSKDFKEDTKERYFNVKTLDSIHKSIHYYSKMNRTNHTVFFKSLFELGLKHQEELQKILLEKK